MPRRNHSCLDPAGESTRGRSRCWQVKRWSLHRQHSNRGLALKISMHDYDKSVKHDWMNEIFFPMTIGRMNVFSRLWACKKLCSTLFCQYPVTFICEDQQFVEQCWDRGCWEQCKIPISLKSLVVTPTVQNQSTPVTESRSQNPQELSWPQYFIAIKFLFNWSGPWQSACP